MSTDEKKAATRTEDEDAESSEKAETRETREPQEGDEAEAAEAAGSEGEAEATEEVKENRKERRKKRRAERLGEGEEPKDRNEKIRAKVKKKQAEAQEEQPQGLTAGELVDDAFARGVHGLGKWARANSSILQGVLFTVVLGGAGWVGWHQWSTSRAEATTDLLVTAVTADKAQLDPEGRKPTEENPDPTYKSREERATAAQAAYKKVTEKEQGTGAAILARLGEAGSLLDLKKWDDAATAYREVRVSNLAAADGDVRCRAIEGLAFAAEGKGQAAEAEKLFKELETQNVRGYVELAQYHQARLLAAKGDVEGTKALIKKAREALQKAEVKSGTQYLLEALTDVERKVDPKAVQPSILGGADRQMSQDEMQRLLGEQLKKLKQGMEHGDH